MVQGEEISMSQGLGISEDNLDSGNLKRGEQRGLICILTNNQS